MRKAFNDYGFIVEDDTFIGISLGYDFCAEHEWGIKGIQQDFGIPEKTTRKNMGIKSRTITICPKTLLFKKDGKDGAILWTSRLNLWESKINEEVPHVFNNYKKNIKSDIEWDEKINKKRKKKEGDYHKKPKHPMISAWSENGFGVAVYGEEAVAWLEFLYEQFKNKNVAITRLNISGNNPFANASLSLVIVDRVPEYALDSLYMSDKSHLDLIDYEKKIGMTKLKNKVIERRRKKNHTDPNFNLYQSLHYYIACSPRWIDYEDKENREKRKKELGTKYDIQYWINYSDDDDNYGWYTVEEIMMWLNGNKKLTEVAPRK